MWIFSQEGFFSIVRKGEHYHVRARRKQDLVNLRLVPTKSLAESDYPWRAILSDDLELPKLMAALGQSIDCPNFKRRIGERPDQRLRLGTYHKIWEMMAQEQDA